MPDLRAAISELPTPVVVHRFRNFGEDVCRTFRDRYAVDLGEIDGSSTAFHVRQIHRRALRSTSNEILRIAAKHFFDGSASVVELQ